MEAITHAESAEPSVTRQGGGTVRDNGIDSSGLQSEVVVVPGVEYAVRSTPCQFTTEGGRRE